jgi:hypothetical protein
MIKTKKTFELKKKDGLTSIDSAFNKIFFYYFEQFLDEFLKKEYGLTKIK